MAWIFWLNQIWDSSPGASNLKDLDASKDDMLLSTDKDIGQFRFDRLTDGSLLHHGTRQCCGVQVTRYSNSLDELSSLLQESIELKKTLAPDKLTKQWTVDPIIEEVMVASMHVRFLFSQIACVMEIRYPCAWEILFQ